MNQTAHSKHAQNDHIEILRAVAILFTIVLHLETVAWNRDSFLLPLYENFDLSVGVDLFLVISGYVITRSLIGSIARSDASRGMQMASFWVRRIYRLLPTAWFWLGVALLINLVMRATTGQLELLWADAVAVAAAVLNVMNVFGTWCMANSDVWFCAANYVHGHYWSLSLEEQFYIVFPLLFFFVRRPVFIGLLITAIAAQFFWHRPMYTLFFYVKADALCWGVLLAFASYTQTYRRVQAYFQQHPRLALALATLAVLAIPVIASRVQGVFDMKTYGVGLVAFMCLLAVFFASLEYRPLDHGSRLTRWMLYIGSRSYALYVIHLILFRAQRFAVRQSGLNLEGELAELAFNLVSCTVAIALTLWLSELNYRWVETPWRNRGREISARMLGRAGRSAPESSAATRAAS